MRVEVGGEIGRGMEELPVLERPRYDVRHNVVDSSYMDGGDGGCFGGMNPHAQETKEAPSCRALRRSHLVRPRHRRHIVAICDEVFVFECWQRVLEEEECDDCPC